MKMTIKYILFLVICYDFLGIDSGISSSIFLAKKFEFSWKDINVREYFSQLHMKLHWNCVQTCAVEDLLVLQHAWLTSSYVA